MAKLDIPQGTLDLMILTIVAREACVGRALGASSWAGSR